MQKCRFLFRFTGNDDEINLNGDGSEKPEFAEWTWMTPQEVIEKVGCLPALFPPWSLLKYLIYFHLSRQSSSKNLYMRKHWNTLPPIYSQIQPLRCKFDQFAYIYFYLEWPCCTETPVFSWSDVGMRLVFYNGWPIWSVIMFALDLHLFISYHIISHANSLW